MRDFMLGEEFNQGIAFFFAFVGLLGIVIAFIAIRSKR